MEGIIVWWVGQMGNWLAVFQQHEQYVQYDSKITEYVVLHKDNCINL